eukprot:1554218-Amphidinium_carterae.2
MPPLQSERSDDTVFTTLPCSLRARLTLSGNSVLASRDFSGVGPSDQRQKGDMRPEQPSMSMRNGFLQLIIEHRPRLTVLSVHVRNGHLWKTHQHSAKSEAVASVAATTCAA